MRNKKKLVITCVNKIKYEERKNFWESLFEGVYKNASRLVRRIIEENEALGQGTTYEDYCSDEQFNNIVAFLGERGMGKSSAMLSFALFLRDYEKSKEKEFVVHTEKTDPVFYLMPRIDVAMLIKGENILDVILAKMWDEFEAKEQKTARKSMLVEDLKEKFRTVKASYSIYRQTISGKDLLQERTSIREMHDFAACLNLRKDFRALVNTYLKYMQPKSASEREKSFLVISIDDLDVAMENVYDILEQIRMFLMIPNVIVLLTADVERLMLSCNSDISDKMICPHNVLDIEKQQIRKYVSNYIAKILPVNMRINMPDLRVVNSVEYEIQMEEYLRVIFVDSTKADNVSFDEKRLLLILLAKYSNILFYPHDSKRHFLQRDSLRNIVNNLYMLLELLKLGDEERFSQVSQWIVSELKEMRKISSGELSGNPTEFLLQVDINYMNRHIFKTMIEMLSRTRIPKGYNILKNMEEDYGVTLAVISEMMGLSEEIRNFTKLLYSVTMALAVRANQTEALCRQNIFYPTLRMRERSVETVVERENILFGGRLNMNLSGKTDKEGHISVKDLILNEQSTVFECFWKATLCDEELWKILCDEEREFECRLTGREVTLDMVGKTSEKNQKEIKVQVTPVAIDTRTRISVDNIFFNALHYEEHLQCFCQKLYESLCGVLGIKVPEEKKKDEISEILKSDRWKLKKYRSWKRKYNVNSVADLLPLQSADVVCHLAEGMPKEQRKTLSNGRQEVDVADLMDKRIKHIIRELWEIESYYEYKAMGYKSYADCVQKYWDIFGEIITSNQKEKVLVIILEADIESTPSV